MKLFTAAAVAALLACTACSQAETPADTAAEAPAVAAAAREEANKATAQAFYDAAINQKDFAKASSYLGEGYIQHNPTAADGPEGLNAFIEFLKTSFPEARSEVKHVYADGDFVILHVHSLREPDTLGRAIVDIFRFDENGKIVEHWDVVQDIPETPANANTMF